MIAQLKLIGLALVAALILGLGIWVAVLKHRTRVIAFRADSLEAVADTTKKVAGAWERRATQNALHASELDDSLHAKPKVVFRTRIQFDTVYADTAVGSPVVEVEGVRRGSIAIDSPAVSLHTDVEMPPPPGNLRLLNVRIGISSIPAIPLVSCSTERFNGLYRAFVALDSLPPWARVEIRDAQADQGVCNPTGVSFGLKLPWWTEVIAAGGGFLAGWLLHPKGAP